MAAWASLDRDTQLKWIGYETTAEPHRPPFDHKAHISGNNLFVSAYHGFALMGDEHTPAPQPFQMPPFAVTFDSAVVENGVLKLTVDAHVSLDDNPERYRLYSRLRLTSPGKGYGVRGMRGYLAAGDCSRQMIISIPGYTEIWNLPKERFQIQAMSIILDSETGFRSQYQRTICILSTS